MAHSVLDESTAQPPKVLNREEMIIQYAPFIKYIAHRLAMRLPSHISLKDLISAGVIGLMHAVSKFDPKKNVDFRTYAEFRIRGAMLDELRALDWVPRSIRQKATQIERTISQLEKERGGPVEDEDIAEALDVSMEGYYNLLNEIRGISLIDMDSLKADDFLDGVPYDKESDPFHLSSVKELKNILARAIEELSPREKTILSLYYYEELTLREIGEVLDLTESRICQIHTKCILKLRAKLKTYSEDAF